ncbi:plasma alpha-L-fucosidase [Lepeophtheirus salmonis]|uniref:plasma alpha-L-fucosidase n=1 Tax=Lepeophtheirus salmonis TaxID=72036 RepID=UPI001AE5DAB5|nr:plasma alpha-L-fucosidase-like [Lepeophtheirus salmonis]
MPRILCTALSLLYIVHTVYGKYTPDWASLDSRPLPGWYDKAKVGIFMHFGPYAVPGVTSEWFWWYWTQGGKDETKYMKQYYSPEFTYQDFGPMLKMDFFNSDEFAQLVKKSGAKYFVFTSKHHDGFANFKSSHNFGWNAVDIGPKRDVVGELKEAFNRVGGVHFGLYYSLFEWFNPLFLADKASNFSSRDYVLTKMIPEIKELVTKYSPEIYWSDGDGGVAPEIWGSKDILAWLFNESPMKDTIVTNDRWGTGTSQKHGSFYSGPDRYNPGHILKHKFEEALTLDKKSWGFRHEISCADVLSASELVQNVVTIVSCGGNILINIGPTKEGTIIPIFEERLLSMGSWLKVNGEGIYDSVPWFKQNETTLEEKIPIWYTHRPDLNSVYGTLFGWPNEEEIISIQYSTSIKNDTIISLLCYHQQPLHYEITTSPQSVKIYLPSFNKIKNSDGCFIDAIDAFMLKFQTPGLKYLN